MNYGQSKAIYLQIVDHICDQILTGKLEPGQRMPSVRDNAAIMEVNANTMMRSYEHLQQRGLIYNRRGIGFFVEDDAPIKILSFRREYFIKHEVEYFYRHLAMFGVSPESLKLSYEHYRETGEIDGLS